MTEILVVGIGACIVFDLWQRALYRATGLPPSNWAMVGRWLLQLLAGGRLIAAGLSTLPEHPHERAVGWMFHYVVAIGYAAVYALLMTGGVLSAGWRDGLIFGVASVIVPWFFFMPVTGAGMLARLNPNPLLACLLALKMHAIFGLALGIGFAMTG